MDMKPKLKTKRILYFGIFIFFMVVRTGSASQDNQKKLPLAPAETDRSTQMLPYHVLPVYGNASLGYYYVNIFIGSPSPQTQSVIVDTGSGILAVPCSNCHSCGHKNHLNPPYDPLKSKSSHVLTCQSYHKVCPDKCTFKQPKDNCTFSVHYAQGSTLEGTWVQDDIRLQTAGVNEEIRTNFGCTQLQTKLFFQQKANGIFGLAPRRQSNLLEQMFKQHSIYNGEKKIFSLCLSSNGGVMTVGGINKQLHPHKTEPDISIPYNDGYNLYSLNGIRQISIGQMFITSIVDRIGGYGIFIDSGSTFSYIPEVKYNQVENLLNHTCLNSQRCEIGRGEDSTCYRLKLQEGQQLFEQINKIFPSIEINIQNKRLEWLPTKYMLLREKKNNEVCMGLQPLNRYLLGANWMYDRDIVFDLKQKMIHIYDNVQCVKQTQIMGQYNEKIENNSDIIFTNSTTTATSWRIKTNSATFIIGIICLVLASVIALILCVVSCLGGKKQQLQIRSEDEQEKAKDGIETEEKAQNKIGQI